MDDRACEERHKAIDKRLDEHEHRLDSHGKEIDELRTSDAVNTTQIENLTKAIGNQTKAIWGLVASVLTTLFGFFIWYIQSL